MLGLPTPAFWRSPLRPDTGRSAKSQAKKTRLLDWGTAAGRAKSLGIRDCFWGGTWRETTPGDVALATYLQTRPNAVGSVNIEKYPARPGPASPQGATARAISAPRPSWRRYRLQPTRVLRARRRRTSTRRPVCSQHPPGQYLLQRPVRRVPA